MNRLRHGLFEPVDGSTLGLFRILFAICMIVEIACVWSVAATDFPEIEFRPTYSALRFTRFLPQPDLNLFAPLLMLVLAGILIGAMTRFCAATFSALYAYVFLLDPSHFNNHYYLITLLGLCLSVVDSSAAFSVTSGTAVPRAVPRWNLALLQGHFALAYFYGGLAKLNWDWLRAEPVRMWLNNHDDHALLGGLVALPGAAEFVAWGGLVFDLTIPFLLLDRRTRAIAIGLTFVFHLTNMLLFQIGVFPFLGLAANVLFLSANTPRTWWRKTFGGGGESSGDLVVGRDPEPRNSVVVLLAVYLLLQLVVPFRHLLHDGHVEWTEEGRNFSWRMMLSYKDTYLRATIVNRRTGESWAVDQEGRFLARTGIVTPGRRTLFRRGDVRVVIPSRFLSRRQDTGKGVKGNPRLLWQWARFLAEEARYLGIEEPEVRLTAVTALNGRPFQFLVDPSLDYATVELPLVGTPEYVVPLEADAPIGDYPETLEEKMSRIQSFLDDQGAEGVPTQAGVPER